VHYVQLVIDCLNDIVKIDIEHQMNNSLKQYVYINVLKVVVHHYSILFYFAQNRENSQV